MELRLLKLQSSMVWTQVGIALCKNLVFNELCFCVVICKSLKINKLPRCIHTIELQSFGKRIRTKKSGYFIV